MGNSETGSGEGTGAFSSGPIRLTDAALFTDFYELTMAAAYLHHGMTARATFSLFVRSLPPTRGFLVAAGLEDVLQYLREFRFAETGLAYLRSLERFDEVFLDHLAGLRFTGDVRAVEEGTVVFANEPILEVSAPMLEAQLVETAVLNICHLQTTLASKAIRSILAARGKPVVEFGLRRAHGIDAGMKAARASYVAGAAMSSNVLAGRAYGIPPTGTMAHSFVSAFPAEVDAFRAFAEVFPHDSIFLIDTYNTMRGVERAISVARDLAARGAHLRAVRIDSGDLDASSRAVRERLDEAGLGDVQILVSGGLDELQIERLVAANAPIDAFGVGTRMDVSADAPYLDIAYKLVEYDGRDVMKLSDGKETWPGAKQVYRFQQGDEARSDWVALARESAPKSATPLLRDVMRDGELVRDPPNLDEIRERCRRGVTSLPGDVKRMVDPAPYPVERSPELFRQCAAIRGAAGQ